MSYSLYRIPPMKCLLLLFVLLGSFLFIHAQPYFDVVTLRGSIAPDAGLLNRKHAPVSYNQWMAGVIMPFASKKDSSKWVVGAITERWQVNDTAIKDLPHAVQSLFFPITFIKPLSNKWTIALSAIPRWNGNAADLFNNSFQMGGVALAAYKKSPSLTYRIGVYYNSEFFGPFVIPLLGFDWRMSNKDNLFGVLPQILTYEHRVSKRLSWGAVYRMHNTSYRVGTLNQSLIPNFFRINEMQLHLTADAYLSKNLLLNIEAGHSLFRRYRMGTRVDKKEYYSDIKVNDSYIIKAAFIYRIRLRE